MDRWKLLIAEDNPDHRLLLVRRLKDFFGDVEITVVSKAADFRAACDQHHFDCLILDYKLEDITAADLLSETTGGHRREDCPCLVISSSSDQSVAVSSFRSGSVDFVSKAAAFQSDELGEAIEKAVRDAGERRVERRRMRKRQYELQRKAETDELTGLFNRRRIENLFQRGEFTRDRRRLMACLMLDLDHFKEINDHYGHAIGDRVLTGVSRVLREFCLSSDVPIRWGGEEFLVLHHGQSLLETWLWADDLRGRIGETAAAVERLPVSATVSIGVSFFPTGQMGDEMIRRADKALYLAKRSGRNRVCAWPMAALAEAADTIVADPASTGTIDLGARRAMLLEACAALVAPEQMSLIDHHCRRVRDLLIPAGRAAGVKNADIERLAEAAMLHDLGMLAMPRELFELPGPLSSLLLGFVRGHADFSADLAKRLGADSEMVSWIRYHHRPWSSFHNASRVGRFVSLLAAADSLAAMTEPRSYRPALNYKQAADQLASERGSRFDPEAVGAVLTTGQSVLSRVA